MQRMKAGGEDQPSGNGSALIWKRSTAQSRSSIQEALGDAAVGVDAAVAQEGPVAAGLLDQSEINLAYQDLLGIMRGLGDNTSKRIGEKAAAPELEPGPRGAVAENVSLFVANPVDRCDVYTVGDGVGALDGLPGVILRCAELVLLGRMPADSGGIEEHLRALHGRKPRALGIPLVPADQSTHAAGCGIDSLEAEIARREVVLLVVERIVGNVHLAVDARQLAVGVQCDGGVVIEARRAALKERSDDADARLASDLGKFCSRGAGDRLSQIKEAQVFALAEILGAKELGQADDLGAESRSFADVPKGGSEVGFWIRPHAHLDKADCVFACAWHSLGDGS